jgi:hypothetical protein
MEWPRRLAQARPSICPPPRLVVLRSPRPAASPVLWRMREGKHRGLCPVPLSESCPMRRVAGTRSASLSLVCLILWRLPSRVRRVGCLVVRIPAGVVNRPEHWPAQQGNRHLGSPERQLHLAPFLLPRPGGRYPNSVWLPVLFCSPSYAFRHLEHCGYPRQILGQRALPSGSGV